MENLVGYLYKCDFSNSIWCTEFCVRNVIKIFYFFFFLPANDVSCAHLQCNQFHWITIWACLVFLITPEQVTRLIRHFSSRAFLISFQSGRKKGYRAVSMVIAGRRNGWEQKKLIFHQRCHAVPLYPVCLCLNIHTEATPKTCVCVWEKPYWNVS